MPKYDLYFNPPLMNAAGSLGFVPDPRGPVSLRRLGAFVTNPVSLAMRTPAHGRRFVPFPGGFLLHTGYPNPGLKTIVRRYAIQWSHAALPVIVHLLPQTAEELSSMAARVERQAGVTGIEVGLPPDIDADAARGFARAAHGELPVILRVPLERALDLAHALAGLQAEGVFHAISLGPPRGGLPTPGGTGSGRLYGPALFPLALAAVQHIAQTGLPVIGAGGVYQPQQADAMLAAGAMAVQLDTVLWRGGW